MSDKKKKKRKTPADIYESKTTEGIFYGSIIPGAKATKARLNYEGMIKKRRKEQERIERGGARGKMIGES